MNRKRKLVPIFGILAAAILILSLFTNTVEAKAAPSNSIPKITYVSPNPVNMYNDGSGTTITATATDSNRDIMTWSILTPPSNGTIGKLISNQINKTTNQVTFPYTPNSGYTGNDNFILIVDDNNGGTAKASITINVLKPVENKSPVNTVSPSISGNLVVPNTLTANPGTWTDEGALTYTYQWQQVSDVSGLNPVDITGATGTTYTLTAGDANKYIRVKVTAKDNGNLTADAYSQCLLVSPAPAVTTINYVAIGDSIATGTIYSGKSITSYVTNFYNYLKERNPTATVNLSNLAFDGAKSNEWYAKLGLGGSTADTTVINAITSANIITISIGGNNLMQAAKDDSSLGGYNFNSISTAIAQQGVDDFNAQWVPIISEVKRLNSKAQIIAITVYNPYNETDTALHNTVDSFLFKADGTGINDIIRNNTGKGYDIADVYGAFDVDYGQKNMMGAITYFYPGPLDLWGNLTRNPHPNSTGQGIITNLHKGVYKPVSN